MQVLLSGPLVANKDEFTRAIRKFAEVTNNPDNHRLLSTLKERKIDVLVFEVLNYHQSDLDILLTIKKLYPKIKIILITNDREFTALAFNLGVKDVFKSPVNFGLLNQRIDNLLKKLE